MPATPEELEAKAALTGRKVIYPDTNELFIDLDGVEEMLFCHQQIEILSAAGEVMHVDWSQSQTAYHWHVVVVLRQPIDSWRRVALQAALGSDRKRELLACLNPITAGTNCFFEVP